MIDKAIFALQGVRAALVVLVAFSCARAFAVVGQAWALAAAIVDLWKGASVSDQVFWIALFVACFVARQVLLYAQETYLDRYAAARADELRQRLLSRVFETGAAVVQKHGTGNVTTLVF